jgi:hypothetical protein
MDEPLQFIELIKKVRGSGFSIFYFQFHYKPIAEPDVALMRSVHDAFRNEDCQFMFSAEGHYPPPLADVAHMVQAIAADCWSLLRIDSATAGGHRLCLCASKSGSRVVCPWENNS